jgi:hypothetical protein
MMKQLLAKDLLDKESLTRKILKIKNMIKKDIQL